jgi:hypothetical protein
MTVAWDKNGASGRTGAGKGWELATGKEMERDLRWEKDDRIKPGYRGKVP